MASDRPSSKGSVRHDSATVGGSVAGSVLGSGAAFLEGTAANVALPAIARDFGLGVEGLQWVVNGYLPTLSALMLLGGSLGDRYRRSLVFTVGCVGFAAASVGCALAPNLPVLVILRLLQGTAGARCSSPTAWRCSRPRSGGMSAGQPSANGRRGRRSRPRWDRSRAGG